MLPGADEHLRPLLAAREHAAGERRQEAGAQDGGLAAAGWADDAEQRGADEARDELGDEPLAAEEVGRVDDLERGESLVGTDCAGMIGARTVGTPGGGLQLLDAPRQLV